MRTAAAVAMVVVSLALVLALVVDAVQADRRRAASSDGQVTPRFPAAAGPHVSIVVGALLAAAVTVLASGIPGWVGPLIGGAIGVATQIVVTWWTEKHSIDLVRVYEDAKK